MRRREAGAAEPAVDAEDERHERGQAEHAIGDERVSTEQP